MLEFRKNPKSKIKVLQFFKIQNSDFWKIQFWKSKVCNFSKSNFRLSGNPVFEILKIQNLIDFEKSFFETDFLIFNNFPPTLLPRLFCPESGQKSRKKTPCPKPKFLPVFQNLPHGADSRCGALGNTYPSTPNGEDGFVLLGSWDLYRHIWSHQCAWRDFCQLISNFVAIRPFQNWLGPERSDFDI